MPDVSGARGLAVAGILPPGQPASLYRSSSFPRGLEGGRRIALKVNRFWFGCLGLERVGTKWG